MTISTDQLARLYLDRYATEHGLGRPLTPEQLKDAGVLFLGLIESVETGGPDAKP